MEQKEIQRLSLLQFKTKLNELPIDDLHVFFNQNVGVVKRFVPDIATSLLNQPFIIDEMRIMVITQGSVHAVVNLLPITLNAGDLTFVDKQSTFILLDHSSDIMGQGFTMNDGLLSLALGGSLPPSIDGHLRNFHISLDQSELDIVTRFINLLYDTIHENNYSSNVFLNLAASLCWWVDCIYTTHGQGESNIQSHEQEVFGQFISLVNAHAMQEHNLSFYANRLCLSPRYLGTLIGKASGRGAKEWIDEALTTAIKVDLRHTSKPLKQIAIDMQFPNMSFFSKFFKRMTGMTPIEYRRQNVLSKQE